MFTYRGHIHIHSTYSDGAGTVSQISEAASREGLDYIIITDHRTLSALPEEGYREGVLVLVGSELNHRYNHILALNINQEIAFSDHQPQLALDAIQAQGGLSFLAHPFETGSPLGLGKAYPWRNWPVQRFTGIEIWNFCSEWRSRTASIWRSAYWFLFNRSKPVYGPSPECLRFWDYCCRGRRVVAIGGSDNHDLPVKIGALRFKLFPYRFSFRAINTYLLMPERLTTGFHRAKQQVYQALRQGRCFLSFDLLSSGKGFYYSAVNGTGQQAVVGEEITFNEPTRLNIISPSRRSLIRVIAGGKLVCQSGGQNLSYQVPGPGIYRVEVYYRPRLGRPRPWIYSNPIYILRKQS
ncbi:MAG TPA: PHP domain-containing protein [Firmicutes bacterium]|nr:PHP domain-containing protein [Bacillota bacterium]